MSEVLPSSGFRLVSTQQQATLHQDSALALGHDCRSYQFRDEYQLGLRRMSSWKNTAKSVLLGLVVGADVPAPPKFGEKADGVV